MLIKRIFSLCASYGLSVVLLLLLMVLVFFGTIEQTRMGLFEVQQRYFESIIVVHWLFDVFPLPLPGGYLLLTLVVVNMVCGAVVAAPKRITRPGLLIAHLGVILLILGGFVSYHYAINGNMPLYEGETSNRFQSYVDWEVRIVEYKDEDEANVYRIPQKHFGREGYQSDRLFYAESLPFRLFVPYYHRNCQPMPTQTAPSVDGVSLVPLNSQQEAEQHVPGMHVLLETADGEAHSGILWALETSPWRVDIEDTPYAISLNRREWELPFSLTLNRFNHERHPGTSIPSYFSSEITLTEGSAQREVLIRMNEPLRHRGYTFYQASWGPPEASPGAPLYSVLAVTRNPAGQWPMFASCIISLGLLIHFSQVLMRYLKRQTRG